MDTNYALDMIVLLATCAVLLCILVRMMQDNVLVSVPKLPKSCQASQGQGLATASFLNYFSSVNLFQDLFNDGISCITTRAYRKKWSQELKSLLLDWGQHESVTVNKVQALVWKDKKNVNLLHNFNTMHDSQEVTTTKTKGWQNSRCHMPNCCGK